MKGKSKGIAVGGAMGGRWWLVVPWLVLWVVLVVEAISCVGLWCPWVCGGLGGENKKE